MKKVMILVAVLVLMALTACGGTSSADTAVAAPVDNGSSVSGANDEETASVAALDDAYENALPVQMQLSIGTILLEDGSLAVDTAQAAELLPLWRAVQSMSASGTAADVEITAVVNQIQAMMTAEQIAAIADMQLTQDAMRELVQEGIIAVEAGDIKRGSGDARGGGLPGSGGPAGGQADPDRQAAREAEGGGDNNLFDQAVTGAVVEMLEAKAGA